MPMSEEFTAAPPTPQRRHHHHLSDIQLLCSYLISHPLYLSYLLFFSPSLLKLLSFLSPLFLTTSLLLLSILFTLSRPSLSYQSLVATITSSSVAHDFDYSAKEALQVYSIVFDVGDPLLPHHRGGAQEEAAHKGTPALIAAEEEGSIMTLATLLLPKRGDLLLPGNHHEEKGEEEVKKTAPPARVKVKSSAVEAATSGAWKETNLGSYGSMRKEKEWTRTLACKLFEERHNADSSEGMDSLWETYETETETESGNNNMKGAKKSKSKQRKKKGAGNKIGHHHYHDDGWCDIAGEEQGGDEEEEEEEEMGGDAGRLCCLQALKFSAGKMNLGGMGKPNLVKISKAIKGFGWLHHLTNRHPKTKKKN